MEQSQAQKSDQQLEPAKHHNLELFFRVLTLPPSFENPNTSQSKRDSDDITSLPADDSESGERSVFA